MRPHTLRHVGSYAFPSDLAVDFDALPPVVAITGPNGAGKTTLLDCIAAPWLGEMAYRPGSLASQFAAPGAIIEEWSLGGQRYRSHLRVDPQAGRTEGLLFADETLIAGPLIRDYRRAVQQLVGPPDFLIASMYATQSGSGAFLTASRAERKALLSELLGLRRYGLWEAAAKDQVRGTETQLTSLRGRVAELERQITKGPDLERTLEALGKDRAAAATRVAEGEAAVQAAQVALEQARAVLMALDPVTAELAQIGDALRDLETKQRDAADRRTKNVDVLGREGAIAAAITRTTEIQTVLADLDARLATAVAAQQAAATAAQAATRTRTTAQLGVTAAEKDRERLQRQAGLLTTVPCGGEGAYASCALLKDAKAAHDGLPAVEAALRSAHNTLAQTPEPMPLVDATAPLTKEKRALEAERSRLAPLVELAGPLSAARARVEELDGQLTEFAARLAEHTTRQQALSAQTAERPARQQAVATAETVVRDAHRQRTAAQGTLSQIERELGQVEGQLTAVRAAGATLATVQAELAPVAQDLADWTLLAKALGPTGIPALLIDQALPELGRLATELLRECYGEAVFTIALRTQREAAAGDKLLETLDVVVSRGAEPIEAALLSGGEKVLVAEALSLALALYAAGRSHHRIELLLRDEVSAPLDVERAPAYVRMLRRAATLGGFRHVLFVTHQERCAELADARLEIRDQRIEVA